jgi:hypothetical protein
VIANGGEGINKGDHAAYIGSDPLKPACCRRVRFLVNADAAKRDSYFFFVLCFAFRSKRNALRRNGFLTAAARFSFRATLTARLVRPATVTKLIFAHGARVSPCDLNWRDQTCRNAKSGYPQNYPQMPLACERMQF